MPLQPNGMPSIPGYHIRDVLSRYREIVPHVTMAGPTSFAPLIHQALQVVVQHGMSYHILVIIADGQVTRSVDIPTGQFSKPEADTINAIQLASQFPLSIVVVGVGDGPWDMMRQFDDALPHRQFDNFQFVDFDAVTHGIYDPNRRETQFALHALMEIPEQYQLIRQLGLLNRGRLAQLPVLPRVQLHPPPLIQQHIASSSLSSSTAFPAYPGQYDEDDLGSIGES
jgi:E3 ubiquitin-protein ligase RGLG